MSVLVGKSVIYISTEIVIRSWRSPRTRSLVHTGNRDALHLYSPHAHQVSQWNGKEFRSRAINHVKRPTPCLRDVTV